MKNGERVAQLLGRACEEVARGESACDGLEDYLNDPGYMHEMRGAFEEVINDAPPIGGRWGVVAGDTVWTELHGTFTLGPHSVTARSVRFFNKREPDHDTCLFVVQTELPHRQKEYHVFYRQEDGQWCTWQPREVIGVHGDSVIYVENTPTKMSSIKVFRRHSAVSFMLFTLEHLRRYWSGATWVAASGMLPDGKSRLHIHTKDGRDIIVDVPGEVENVICRHHEEQESWLAVTTVAWNSAVRLQPFAVAHESLAVVSQCRAAMDRFVDAQWDGAAWWYAMYYRTLGGLRLLRNGKHLFAGSAVTAGLLLRGMFVVTRLQDDGHYGLTVCLQDGTYEQTWRSRESIELGPRLFVTKSEEALEIEVPQEGSGEVIDRVLYTKGIGEKIAFHRVDDRYVALLIRREGHEEARFFSLRDDPCPKSLITTEGRIDETTIVVGVNAKGVLQAYAQVKLPSGYYTVRGAHRIGAAYRRMRGPWLEDGYPVFAAAGRVKTVRVRWPFP